MKPTWVYPVNPSPPDVQAVINTREDLESAGLLEVVPFPPNTVLSWDEWYVLCNEYAYAAYSKIPFCWIHAELVDHLREIARWAGHTDKGE